MENTSKSKSSPPSTKKASAPRASRKPSTPDAIAFLKAEHREVEKLFKAFEKAGDSAHKTKHDLVTEMISSLSQHAAIEEEVLYPAARMEVPMTNDAVLEALEEHHIVKWQLQELSNADSRGERFNAKVTVLMEMVRHHVKEEEGELFPALRQHLGAKQLRELGDQLRAAKKVAPTQPHPRASDEPGSVVTNALVGVLDHARDALKSVR